MATHLAAVTLAKGKPFEVQTRPTPKPGPGELLIQVKSVALNPADNNMRNHGYLMTRWPTVIGFDMAGLVIEAGEGVPQDIFQSGITRIVAYAACYWRSWDPNYGPFQEKCLVPWQHAVALPTDSKLSWNEAATLPVSTQVPQCAWDAMGIPRLQSTSSTNTTTVFDDKEKKEALLIWGASSSVGSMGVQSARLLRDEKHSSIAAVYATASAVHHEYIVSLGADRVFDYKDPHVVDSIVSAAKENNLVIRHCFLAAGDLTSCQAVLKSFVEEESGATPEGKGQTQAKLASAPLLPDEVPHVPGVETMFLMPPAEEQERLAHFEYCLGTWLRKHLAEGSVAPSPGLTVVGKGVGSINAGLDVLLRGVSCTKLVVEIDE